ncbi:MAG TPA: sodium/proline symporter [Sedimentibacter sp.]|nr:sodium/proline symporter [Sedimentibacter sp.]
MKLSVLIPFVSYLLIMLFIGMYSMKRIKTYDDFIIGGRSIGAWVSSFALITSYASGYTYTAAPGMAYTGGWSTMWWATGDAPGNSLSFGLLGRRLRKFSELLGAITLPEYYEKRFKSPGLRLLTSIIIIATVSLHLTAQWQASGILLSVTFGTDYLVGMLIGGVVVLAYTIMGGYLATVYTDFMQGVVMFIGTHILFWSAISKIGGFNELNNQLALINPGLVTPWGPDGSYFGLIAAASPVILIIMGSFGMPHVTVRHLSLKEPDTARKAMLITAIFVALFSFAYYMVGAAGLILLGPGLDNPETSGVLLWFEVLSPVGAGILVSAAVASIMSTADGFLMLLVSTIAHDILNRFLLPNTPQEKRIQIARVITAIIAILSLIVAIKPPAGVFTIVMTVFGGMALAFGIPNIFSVYWKGSTKTGAIACVVLSLTVYVWLTAAGVELFGMSPFMNGLIVAILAFVIGSLISQKPGPEMEELFHIGTSYGPLPESFVKASNISDKLKAEAIRAEKLINNINTLDEPIPTI